jgi:FAD/FMN-containing dehydrogenase/Fe-S oxidoreductase
LNEASVPLSVLAPDAAALAERLRAKIKGDVRFDRLARTLYATDASIYEIVPLGVVLPRDAADVVAVVNECRVAGVSIIARGGGTGLAGGAVGPGVQLDLSRYMNRIGPLDLEARTVEVEPGVVLDELNAFLAPHSLHFAPDVATSSRATIGGMIANNSCGAHSIVYGRTVDHVAELAVVLSDGRTVVLCDRTTTEASPPCQGGVGCADIDRDLARIRDAHHDEIERRFPKVMRSNGGYGLDRLGPPGTPASAVRILCGSEGTLGVVVRAKLKLVPIPKHTGLVVLHFDSLLGSLRATPLVLKHQPSAVELIDRFIIDAGRSNAAISRRCGFLQDDPEAILVVEFFANGTDVLTPRIAALVAETSALGAYAATTVPDGSQQADVWKLRTSGLGLLMSRPGDAQPYSFIEDSAVDPVRLREYIERLSAILDREGVHAGYYAHTSVGLLHVKPVLNLKLADDVERMRRIADSVSSLALEFGGAVTGEHGDGIVRSCWIEKTYGPRIVEAFREVKHLFDPHGLMNPHKIVDPWPMTDHLRHGPAFRDKRVVTHLDFSAHGGMAGLAGMCSGVGQCRQRLVGTMCPSYMAAGDETHTTRARANALRVALSNRGLLDGLDDPALAEVMELCLSCKACKTECPTGVDMARLKAEYLSQRILTNGSTARARLIADLPSRLAKVGRFPRLVNLFAQSNLVRGFLDRRYGIDRRIPPPRLATQTFRAWFRRHRSRRRRSPDDVRPRIVYFVDTWTNYFTPRVGIAAVMLLERAGFHVLCPMTVCCGRPAISQGLLADAQQAASYNVDLLAPLALAGVPIVGTEPSCTLTLIDEYPQLVRTSAARRIAAQTFTIETFLRRFLDDHPDALPFRASPSPSQGEGQGEGPCAPDGPITKSPNRPITNFPIGGSDSPRILYHAHCHQKALVGSADAVALLRRAFGDRAAEINSGCCGMAGAFGHEMEHYEVARAVGEQRLFPAIRNDPDAAVAVSGFSCRHQIEHHTDRRPRHLVELIAAALA